MASLVSDLFGPDLEASAEPPVAELARSLRRLAERLSLPEIRREIHGWLQEPGTAERMAAAARETSTHYVWPLHASRHGWSLVLNEFKPPAEMAPGYATTVHDHRYSFATLALSGGYVQVRHAVSLLDSGGMADLREVGVDSLEAGQVLAVNHGEFHRLVKVLDGTLTLLLKCPAVKGHSISVDTVTHRVHTYVPVEARVPALADALSRAPRSPRMEAGLDV